jgi:hypothetical protein
VNASLDRTLPKIDNELRMRYVALDLMRLDELISVFAKRAIEKADAQAAMLVVKALERRAASEEQTPTAEVLRVVSTPSAGRRLQVRAKAQKGKTPAC